MLMHFAVSSRRRELFPLLLTEVHCIAVRTNLQNTFPADSRRYKTTQISLIYPVVSPRRRELFPLLLTEVHCIAVRTNLQNTFPADSRRYKTTQISLIYPVVSPRRRELFPLLLTEVHCAAASIIPHCLLQLRPNPTSAGRTWQDFGSVVQISDTLYTTLALTLSYKAS